MSHIAYRIDKLPSTPMLRKILFLTGIGWMFDAMDQGMVSGVIAAIASDWGLDTGQLALLSSIGTKPNFKSIGPKYGKDVKKVQQIINNLTHHEIAELEANNELEKDTFKITKDDVEIFTENIEGWIVETDNNFTIALDTKLDSALIEEGISREFINRIQNYRKTNNYNVNDKINVFIKADSNILNAINKNFSNIKNEINCNKLIESKENGIKFYETEINEIPCKFYIEKIS